MRVIDADALLESVESITWYSKSKKGRLIEGATSDVDSYLPTKDVWSAIKTAPTLDVEQVVHAKWVVKEKHGVSTLFSCSRCGSSIEITNDYYGIPSRFASIYYPYCHCGAKMDEDKA